MTFEAEGIRLDLPRGWDAQVQGQEARSVAAARTGLTAAGATQVAGAVLHAATFPLPATRGDYGSGAVEVMGGSDVLVCLLEHEPEAARTALFGSHRVPRLTPAAFSPQAMQRALPGRSGTQHFFTLAGRPFCLYVVVGSHSTRGPLVRLADSVVASLTIEPR